MYKTSGDRSISEIALIVITLHADITGADRGFEVGGEPKLDFGGLSACVTLHGMGPEVGALASRGGGQGLFMQQGDTTLSILVVSQ